MTENPQTPDLTITRNLIVFAESSSLAWFYEETFR